MMRSFLLVAVLVLALAACSKSHSIPPGLTGNWKLVASGGGFAGSQPYTGSWLMCRHGILAIAHLFGDR